MRYIAHDATGCVYVFKADSLFDAVGILRDLGVTVVSITQSN